MWLAIDLSRIGLDIPADFCLAQLERIAATMTPGRLIQIGAEDSSRTDRILDVVLAAIEGGLPVMATVQADLQRSPVDAVRLAAAGVPIRLVKGAYVEPTDRVAGADARLGAMGTERPRRPLPRVPFRHCRGWPVRRPYDVVRFGHRTAGQHGQRCLQ